MTDYEWGLLAVLFGGFAIWAVFQIASETMAKSNWISRNKGRFDYESEFLNALNKLGSTLIACNKCDSSEMQMWALDKFHIEYRCANCKKKFLNPKIDQPTLENLVEIWNKVLILINEQYSLQKYPTGAIAEYIRTHLRFNYWNLRRNSPYVRAIYFDVNPDINANQESTKGTKTSRRISQATMDKVWRRDGGKCSKCGTNEKLEFDHIIPFSKGGSNGYRNIQLLCENCNRSKTNNIG